MPPTGSEWRYLFHNLPPWPAVYQQGARWRDKSCFEHLPADLRKLARPLAGRIARPWASATKAKKSSKQFQYK